MQKKAIDVEICPICGRYNNRSLTADGIIERDDSILLIKRGHEPFKGMWALPGGHINRNETIEEGIAREVKEETGLTVDGVKFLNIYSNPDRDPMQKITIAYKVDASGDARAGDDAIDYKWYNIHELPEMAADHSNIIKEYLNLRN